MQYTSSKYICFAYKAVRFLLKWAVFFYIKKAYILLHGKLT